MSNEKNEYKNDNEEIEYHLVDDDVQYEEISAEDKMHEGQSQIQKKNFFQSLSPKQRMALGAGVLGILIYLAYHLISGSEQPNLEIKPVEKSQTNQIENKAPVQNVQQPVSTPVSTANNSAIQNPVNNTVNSAAANNNGMTSAAVNSAQTQASNIPAVIPVPSAPVSASNQIESKIEALAAANQQMLSELQNNYLKKMATLSQENKVLQEQMQTLSSRLVTLEAQLNKSNAARREMRAPTIAASEKSNYEIQAIIPGRAWLRSDNGETITVTEGDVIRGLGRVKKIDPYEGVVEIISGDRTITLSYNSDGN